MGQLSKILFEALESDSIPENLDKLYSFFKVYPGGYGEGDQFIGTKVPIQRKLSKKYFKDCTASDLEEIIKSPFHEMRLTGVFMLVLKYQKAKGESARKQWVDFFLNHLDFVNGWDLVDSSAHHILGDWLLDKDRTVLYTLANSGHLWRERVAVISTFKFIRENDFEDALKLAEKFLGHSHDLIHKAVGWMVREVGNRDVFAMVTFLDRHYSKMPRTMLRYAIEKLPEEQRQAYLKRTR